jgi:retinol dehydrogenase 12
MKGFSLETYKNFTRISIFLMLILTPLLFIHSQYNIFDYFNSNINSKNINNSKDYSRLNNKVIVITGGSSGIGEGIVDILMKYTNSILIILNRKSNNLVIFLQKIAEIQIKTGTSRIFLIECDLTDLTSVTNAYKIIINQYPKGIDILINNAGISNTLNEITIDGYNNQIQTNFISHALLIELFIKNHMTRENKNLEIINISSMAYNIPNKKYDKYKFKKLQASENINDVKYLSNIYYQQSKLALLLYTNHLNNEIIKHNRKIKVFCLHPGICKTDLLHKSKLPFCLKFFLNNLVATKVDYPCSFIVDKILNNNIITGDFYGINVFFNLIEKIENNDLINPTCSKNLYLQIQKILRPYL